MKMEQNKLENEIKTQLENRTIAPSANAWDRLDAMLTINEKPKKRFPWLLVAASFIGFVFVGTIIFQTRNISPTANDQINSQVVINDAMTNNPNSKISNPIPNHQEIIQNPQITSNSSEQYTKSKTKNRVSIINQNQIAITNQNQKNETKINEILNQNKAVSQEINENKLNLTANQSIEIASNNSKSETKSISVDANALLSQVDKEINTEYRETVLQKISRKYQSARTVFVERNIQK